MICPKCKEKLQKVNNTYKCCNNHSYDISKEGYVNLLLSKTNSGDNKDLIDGRINFLSKDFYKPLANKIVDILNKNNIKTICDCGCGIGYYSNIFKNSFNVYGFDISKDAIKYASKHDKISTYFVSSSNNIMLEDNTIDATIHIFSPYFVNEDYRILVNDGLLIIVLPGINHLIDIKELLYKNTRLNNDDILEFKNFILLKKDNLSYKIKCDKSDILNLIKMTPYYYTTKKEDIENININNLECQIDFNIYVFKKLS